MVINAGIVGKPVRGERESERERQTEMDIVEKENLPLEAS